MYIEDRLYSEYEDEVYYSVVLDEDELRLYSEFQERIYGTSSKIGAFLSPGGWNAKELAKLQAKDEDDYEDHKHREYLKGMFAPGLAAYRLHQAQKLARKGASPEEIKKKTRLKGSHVALGYLGELATGGHLGNLAAVVKGAQTKMDEDERGMRRKFKRN